MTDYAELRERYDTARALAELCYADGEDADAVDAERESLRAEIEAVEAHRAQVDANGALGREPRPC